MSDGNIIVWVSVIGFVISCFIMAKASGGVEIGCALVVLPIVAFGVIMTVLTTLIFVSGINWITFLVTDGNCARKECMFQGKYPQECKLPPIISTKYCVRPQSYILTFRV